MRFPSKEKCPTIRVIFFFLQTTNLTLIGPFLKKKISETTKAKSGQGKLSAKGPPFSFYFFNVTYKTGRDKRTRPSFRFWALCDFFFENCLMSQKVLSSSFLILCNRMSVNKSKKVRPFTFFGTMRRFPKEKNHKL